MLLLPVIDPLIGDVSKLGASDAMFDSTALEQLDRLSGF